MRWIRSSLPRTLATAHRVLDQLRHDLRTVLLILTVPCGLLALLKEVYRSTPAAFQAVGGSLTGVFPCVSMFLVSSIVIQRERSSGTLERLLAMPLGKTDLIAGYTLGFATVAAVQGSVITTLALRVLGLDIAGPWWLLLLTAMSAAILGLSLGLFVSAFAGSEFQALQFMPGLLLPQFMLSGVLVPRDRLPAALEQASHFLPLSYAVDGATQVRLHREISTVFIHDIATLWCSALTVLLGGAATLRRRTR
ncbi:ABC transporter permease [Kitasatospora sp. NBC_01287]|uniref:ABC transporter permease n=1 Tax=Kitasatospora sp. NBC_01287 TaxID=2903573 RepID=UPI00225B91B4|nr:ABC transporter permease [Kitasatospora sp. NBC_01287]MCX4745728.1 ABC transporter permease [Kitasatospora sp. NBC_01287]